MPREGLEPTTPLWEADFKFAKSELLDRFIASKRESLSQRTIDKSYRVDLNHSREVIGFNVTGQQIQQFLNSRRCSNGGKHAYYRCLHAFYCWLYSPKSGFNLNHQNNPILIVDPPKVEKKILPSLTTEQVEYFIQQAECIRDKTIISLFADSGLRLSELADIKTEHIGWEHKLIKGKYRGNKGGLAVFGQRTESLLKQWLSQYNAGGRLWDINRVAFRLHASPIKTKNCICL